ncbi:protein of unknown function [Methanocaldococcus lauensis]|nr:protein of unknown function [Methanocaldococcus lauensis]
MLSGSEAMHPGYPNRAEPYGFKTQTPKGMETFKFYQFVYLYILFFLYY